MKKILFLGRSAGVYKTNRKDLDFIALELVKKNYIVEVFDPKKNILLNINQDETKKIQLFGHFSKTKLIQRTISFINLIYFCLKYQGQYEYVQVNYVREEYLLIPKLIKRLGKKFKIFIYGDDINIRSKLKNKLSSIYNHADEIIMANRNIFNRNRKYFSNANTLEKKIKIICLPQIQLKYYEEFDIKDKFNAKDKLNLTNKKVLLVGISSHPNEQHDKIIEGLSTLRNPESYHVIIPLSSREFDNSKWVHKIKFLAKKHLSKIDHSFIEGYKTIEEVATYRLASDILINLRKRDQLNAALIESNYAFCQIISGDWLPYEDYWSKFKTEKINSHWDLSEKVEDILNDNDLALKLKQNRKVAEQNYSYRVIKEWLALYNNN